MIDLDAPESPEQLRETAAEMPSFYFLGEELKPFSLGRQLAFERVVAGSGSNSLELCMAMVYLCTIDTYERTRTQSEKESFRSEMVKWAEAKGINIRKENHAGEECKRIGDEILAALEASEFDVKLKPDQKSKDLVSPNESGREAQ
jgi:hypothetical protein